MVYFSALELNETMVAVKYCHGVDSHMARTYKLNYIDLAKEMQVGYSVKNWCILPHPSCDFFLHSLQLYFQES